MFSYQLAGHGVYRGTLTHSGEARSGYAVITSDSGGKAGGRAVFQYRDADGKLISEAGVGDVRATRRARIYVDTDQTDTGIAIAAFGHQGPVQLTVRLRDRYGDLLEEVTFPDLVGGGHLAEFVSQIFSGRAGFRGVMEIQGDAEFYPVTLKLTSNQLSQPILTTLPLADLDHPLEANSVVIPQLGFGQSDGLELSTRLILIDQDDPELNPSASGSFGEIRFRQSSPNTLGGAGVPLQVPLFGENGNEFEYRIDPGGANRLRPGDSAGISQIVPNVTGGEVPVVVGREANVRPQVIDSTGELRDDFQFSFSSLDPQVASIDALGRIRAHEEGFSTLAIEAAGSLETATITVTETGDVSTGLDDIRGPFTDTAQDTAGKIYLASSNQHSVWRADAGLELFAGTKEPGFTDDVPRLQAQFDTPSFLALTKGRNPTLYVSDSANHRIRTVAFDADEGTVGTLPVNLDDPQGVALDNFGHLWVADRGSRTIQRIRRTDGEVEIILGQGDSGCSDGPAELALFMEPIGIAKVPLTVDQQLKISRGASKLSLSLIVADKGCNSLRRIRCESPNCTPHCDQDDEECSDRVGWQVETIRSLGTTQPRQGLLTATPPPNTGPTGVAIDPAGNIFFSQPETGQVSTLLTTGRVVAAAQSGFFVSPEGLDISQSGRLLVADRGSAREIVYGAPQITDDVSPVGDQGGEEVTIRGRNFAPDSLVVIRGEVIRDLRVTDTSTIQFTAPPLPSGLATLTVQNRGGIDQASFLIRPPSLVELKQGEITTVAGGSTFIGDGGTAELAAVQGPSGFAIDPQGNLFFSDTDHQRIRRVDAITGIITTVAGTGVLPQNLGEALGDGGPALEASLAFPRGLALDAAGNLYFAEEASHRVRMVKASDGTILTVAGGGSAGLGDGDKASKARLNGPRAVVVAPDGRILIADTGNNRIRQVTPPAGEDSSPGDGTITTLAGGIGASEFSCASDPELGDGCDALNARLNAPSGLAWDEGDIIYIADSFNHRIRKIDNGKITTVFEFSGSSAVSTVRTATTLIGEPLNTPRGVSVDINGALLIADTGNHAIRRYDPQTGMIATVAGTGRKAFSGDGGAADQATLDSPHWVAADGAGNLFVADTGNGRIRRVEPRKQEISTYAGAGPDTNIGDGDEAIKATLNFPSAVAFAPDGDLFIADSGHHLVRRVHGSKSNCISTVVGTGGRGSCDEGDSALLGSGNSGTLRFPGGLDIDDEGNLFIADSGNQIVRRYDPQGMLVETGVAESDIKLSFPQGIMFDSEQEELFITDTANHRVLLADSMLSLSLFAGTGQRGAGQASGPAQAVMLNGPLGVGIGPQGDVYIADSFNNRILKVDRRSGTTPTVSIAAGEGTSDLGDNGPAILAQLDFPTGLAFDRAGNLFIADALHHRIRRVDAQTGVISTFAGSDLGFKGDGGPASDAKLNFPSALRFGKDGSLFIADRNNHRVRAIKLSPPPPLSADDARVEMSVTTASDSVNPGEILDYNLAISNSTSEPISSLELTDMLPASVSLKSAIPSQGSCQSSPGRQVTCDLGTLRPEAEATVRIQVTVEDSAAGSIITNSASCHYQPSGSEPCQAAVSTRVGPTVGFALSFPEEVFFPSPIRYDIVVANHGAEPATGVTLRDTLPVGVTLLSSTTDTCTEDRGVLTCNLGDLAPRDEAEVSIEVSPQTANTTLTNLVEVFSDHTASITEVASTRVEPPREGLFLERTVPARKVNPGDSFGYTLTVTNAGLDQKTNVDVSVDVKLGDVMAGAARVQISGDIRFGCQESSSGLVCRLGTLSGEEKASIDITVRPLDAAAGHTLNSTASCRSDQTSNDQCRAEKVSTLVRPQDCADLAVTVDGPPVVFHSAQDREDIVYTLQVSNNGRSPGTGVRLTSVLPRDVAYKEYKQGGGGGWKRIFLLPE